MSADAIRALVDARSSRRAFLVGAAAALAVPAAAAPAPVDLALCKIRHATFLLDVGGTRVLVDPSFAPGVGLPFLFDAPDPAIAADALGVVDVLLVGHGGPTTFDPRALRRLRGRKTSCFVADERVAKSLRHLGFRRVRVVAPGDRYETRGVVVTAAPAGPGALGFVVERGGRSVWHTGAPPPLDEDAAVVRFASSRTVEVAIACMQGLTTVVGNGLDVGPGDAALLASLARARFVVPAYDDAAPSLLGRAFLRRSLDEPWPAGAPRRVVVERGVWYRVAPEQT